LRSSIEKTFLLALLHRRLGGLVVERVAPRSVIVVSRGLGQDGVDRVGVGLDRRGAGDVADGAKTHPQLLDRSPGGPGSDR
jgi:hypothetical protein